MANILQSLGRTVLAGFVLLVLIVILVGAVSGQSSLAAFDQAWWAFFFRWLHVLSGVMWIGLLWYFNFVQIPSMPKIPDEQKPAIGKVIAPTALFWFRHAALVTMATGLILAYLNGYIGDALTLGYATGFGGRETAIGIGMWLGLIMAFNVWFVIWPNQQKALGLVEASADAKKKAARTAMLFSRTNTMLSIPMLYAMVSAQNLY
ncbi:MAG: urate hydroxylase PuuD [Alphaproteobacteria bacterium]